jgi:catechol 2,3-dioxygenase-like lactoylglutathione lyase family enzyme
MEVNAQPDLVDGILPDAVPEALDHVAIPVRDAERARGFYRDVVGLKVHPTKPNWLLIDGHGAVNVLELPDREPGSERYPAAHLAFRVASLEAVRDRLLATGLVPWQNALDWSHRDITDTTTSLDWGIGTLFVLDPDGNGVEFIELGRGIFALHARD